ncbi:hypothetical protein BGZ83_005064 [Gryganskiella cystojenkinii]|nr:hypothetical protein BGZ83_005064 [Gryganskiella cystojenkinii]
METDSSLTVVISSPTHSPHKFTLELTTRRTTILQLKDIITLRQQQETTAETQTRLTAADQRLIYGGRILDDNETLDGIFEKVDCSNAPMIHLVVSPRHAPGSNQQHHSQQQYQRTSAPGTPSPLRFRMPSTASASSVTNSNTNGFTAATTGTDLNSSSLFTPMTRSSSEPPSSVALPLPDMFNNNSATFSTERTFAAAAAAQPKETTATTPVQQVPHFANNHASLLPFQHVLVNGMPYLVPAAYMPMLHLHQQMQINTTYPYLSSPLVINADGTTTFYQNIPPYQMGNMTGAQTAAAGPGLTHGVGQTQGGVAGQPGATPVAGAAVAGRELNAQDLAARDQRRAASLWLFLKLAFGVYLFSQNGSIERIVLLNIAALIIFLHQTGRLRIVRRIVHQPGDQGQGGHNPGAPAQQQQPQQQPTQQPQTTTSTTTTTTTTSTSTASSSTDNRLNDNTTATSSLAGSSNTTSSDTHGSSSSFTTETTQPMHTSPSPSNEETTTATTMEGVNAEQQQQPQPQPRLSTWRSIEHALLTFVTSLVPAPPPEIDPAVANAAAAGERM